MYMNKLFKQKVRRVIKENPDLPIKFIVSTLKAKQDMLFNSDTIKPILQSEMDEISNLVEGVEIDK